MVVFLLIDDLLIISGYILGLTLLVLFEYKIAPKIGNIPDEENIFYNRFKFAQIIILLRLIYLIGEFFWKYF